jgi:hypothetical protein
MEYFNEVWTNQGVRVEDLIDECPPAMASSMTHLLYGRVLSTVPPFRGLSTEVRFVRASRSIDDSPSLPSAKDASILTLHGYNMMCVCVPVCVAFVVP